MGLLKNRVGVLLLALAFGTAAGCAKADKDESSEDDSDKKKKKKKKKKKSDKKAEEPAAKGPQESAKVEPPKPVLPAPIVVEPPNVDEASKVKAKALESKVRNARFDYDDVRDQTNAKAFVHLAATATSADVTVAALRAMSLAFTSYDQSKERAVADEDYARAVLMKIQDAEPRVQGAAIKAAGHSVNGNTPHAKVVDALVDLAANHPKPEGKYAAIDVLGGVQGLAKNPAWLAPFIKAFDAPEAYLVSEALANVKYRLYDAADKPTLKTKFEGLLKHADPGVRGNAAQALAHLAGYDDAVQAMYAGLIMPLLDDPNPFTKSAACSALATLGHKQAIHKIVTFVDDSTKSDYDIKGWTELDGDPGWQHHDASAWSTVGDAALSALRTLSRETKVKFQYDVNFRTKDADLKKAAAEAKKWYAQVKPELGS
jgi:HEAT repeat protein